MIKAPLELSNGAFFWGFRMIRKGGCLCGGIKFELRGELEPIQICHCEECRKAQGTPFVTNIAVLEENFSITQGEALLKGYESSPGKMRVFCSHCGAPILSKRTSLPGVVRVRAGLIEGDLPVTIAFHIFTADKANWWPILDAAPQYPGFPP